MIVIVYHWESGDYVNSYCQDTFELGYAELCAQYGPPSIAIVEYR